MTMKRTATQRLADGLVVLSFLLLLADMLLILFLPALAYFRSGEPTFMTMAQLQAIFVYDFDDGLGNLMRVILYEVWQKPETAVLALFSLACWRCRRRLDFSPGTPHLGQRGGRGELFP